jgi:hypothetical protein
MTAPRTAGVLKVVDQTEHQDHVELAELDGVQRQHVALLQPQLLRRDSEVVAHEPRAPDIDRADVDADGAVCAVA